MVEVEQAVILMAEDNGYLSPIIPQLEELKLNVSATSDPDEFQKLYDRQRDVYLN